MREFSEWALIWLSPRLLRKQVLYQDELCPDFFVAKATSDYL